MTATEAPEDMNVEGRNETISAKVTQTERRDIHLVAGLRDQSVSELLREKGITAILEEAAEIRRRHAVVA